MRCGDTAPTARLLDTCLRPEIRALISVENTAWRSRRSLRMPLADSSAEAFGGVRTAHLNLECGCGWRHLPDAQQRPCSSEMSPLRARVENGRLRLDEPVDLPDGTVVDLVADDEGDDLSDAEREALHQALLRASESANAGSKRRVQRPIKGVTNFERGRAPLNRGVSIFGAHRVGSIGCRKSKSRTPSFEYSHPLRR